MKILFLSPYIPIPPTFGGSIRIYNLLKGLAKNHYVTLLTFGSEDKRNILEENIGILFNDYHLVKPTWSWTYRRLAQFLSLFSSKSFFSLFTKSDEMQGKIDKLLKFGQFDVVQIEFPIMANFCFNTTALKILDEHNIEYDNFRRMWEKSAAPLIKLHYLREYKKTRKEEIKVLKKMDLVLTVSNKDRNTIKNEIEGKPIYIIPNGVDTRYFKPEIKPVESFSMVFTGMMAYMPNHDGMSYFLDKIFPIILNEIPVAKVYIVGNRPPKNLSRRASKNVIITGYVPDVRPYIWKASLYIVPLRMGGGTRLKVLEALAMKKPVVSTSIGCEGIELTDNESILIADDPVDFAQKTVYLLKNALHGERIANEGYNLIHAKYDWETISSRYEEILHVNYHCIEKVRSPKASLERIH